jgi:large subunit ribosomal protein L28e
LFQTSFLHKRESGRIQFTSEPCNLTNLNSFKYSGLANSKAADIKTSVKVEGGAVKVDNGIIITTKLEKKSKKNGGESVLAKPALLFKAIKSTNPSKQINFRRIANCVRKTIGGHYRPDLVKPALARWTKYHRSLVAIKTKVRTRRGLVSRDSAYY